MEITKEHKAKMDKGLKGIYNLSPSQEEPYFLTCGCDICSDELAGDKYGCYGTLGKKHTDTIVELLICVDCYMYLFT